MRKKIYILIVLMLSVLYGCSDTTVLDTKTVAENLSDERKAALGYTEDNLDYYGENVQAYIRSDGKTCLRVFSAPIEYSNNLIEDVEDEYVACGSYFPKVFPKQLSDKTSIKIGDDYDFAEIMPPDGNVYASEMSETINAFGQKRKAVVYSDMFGKEGDYRCYATAFGVNTEIVLPKRAEQNTFRIKLKLPNLVPDTGSPDYILFKTALEKGQVQSILYTPLAVDKKGKWCYSNTVRLIEKDSSTNTYTVEYTIDQKFLQDKSTKYPVALNQSIHLYKPKQPDTSAYENTGEQAGHYLSPYMLLGDKTIKGEGWTFVRYETLNSLNIPADKIVSAKYVFHNLFDLEKEAKIGAYAVTADWCSINTRWFNRPPFDEKPISEVLIKDRGDYELDITALMKEMIANKERENAKYSVQNSFLIRSDSIDSNMIFASGDNGLFSPVLEIVLSE